MLQLHRLVFSDWMWDCPKISAQLKNLLVVNTSLFYHSVSEEEKAVDQQSKVLTLFISISLLTLLQAGLRIRGKFFMQF
jgi:hypothetical protein